jgi:hypothetical protein
MPHILDYISTKPLQQSQGGRNNPNSSMIAAQVSQQLPQMGVHASIYPRDEILSDLWEAACQGQVNDAKS